MDTRKYYPLYLCILAGLLFFPALGARDFWAPVEPRYAEIARVMFAKGEWIVPTVNGDLYTDKPILYFWLVLIASKIVGAVNEWTVRLPPALAGLGFVLATYFMGRDFFSARIGFIAGAVVATTVRVIWEARWAHTDMVFVFFFALSLYFAARALFRKGNPNEMLFAYALMGLATLTKGLIGVVLPALLLLTLTIVRRDWRLLLNARLSPGIPIFLLVAAPWFLLVNNATDGKWLSDFIYIHHIQRYTAGAGHRQPFYYYFTTLPVDLMPWTVFAVAALFAYRPWRKLWDQPVSLFLTLWFFVVFVFFSISNTKRDLYLLPLFPPVALFIANYFDDLINGSLSERPLYRILFLIFFHLVWVIALGLPVAAWFLRKDAIGIVLPSAMVMAAGGILAVFCIQRRQPWKLFQSTTLMMLLVVLSASFLIMPYLEEYKSRRPFSREIKRRVPPGASLYIYADTMNDFNYYTEREVIPVVKSTSELERLVLKGSSGYILIKDRDLQRLNTVPKDRVIAANDVGGTRWNLISLGGQLSPQDPQRN